MYLRSVVELWSLVTRRSLLQCLRHRVHLRHLVNLRWLMHLQRRLRRRLVDLQRLRWVVDL